MLSSVIVKYGTRAQIGICVHGLVNRDMCSQDRCGHYAMKTRGYCRDVAFERWAFYFSKQEMMKAFPRAGAGKCQSCPSRWDLHAGRSRLLCLFCSWQSLITFVNKHLNKLNLEVTELETQVCAALA